MRNRIFPTIILQGVHIILTTIFGISSFVNLASADGLFFSDTDLHLYQPNQKAVLYWNGQRETMILAASVKANDIANFAWLIPIPSSVKPNVTASDIEVFKTLVRYFAKEEEFEDLGRGAGGSVTLGSGVTVIETKEIDIYDIVILKADNAQDLITWANKNEYKIPQAAISVLDKYIAKRDFYFVITKIDLRNKFAKEIKELNAIYDKLKKEYEKEYSELYNRIVQRFYDFGIDNSVYHFDYHPNSETAVALKKDFIARREDFGFEREKIINLLSRYLRDKAKEGFSKKGISPNIDIDLEQFSISSDKLEIALGLNVEGLWYYSYGSTSDDAFKVQEKISPGTMGWQNVNYLYFSIPPLTRDNEEIAIKNIEQIRNKIEGIKRQKVEIQEKMARFIDSIRLASKTRKEINKDKEGSRTSLWKNQIKVYELQQEYDQKYIDKINELFSLQGRYYSLFVDEVNKRYKIVKEVAEPVILKMQNLFDPYFWNLVDRFGKLRKYSSESHAAELPLLEKVRFLNQYRRGEYIYAFKDLSSAVSKLGRGISTPLQIEFQPAQPYYPLEISSLNKGYNYVEVYVISDKPVFDMNNILSVDESIEIGLNLRNELSKYIKIETAKYVTRLEYNGESIGFTSDALFKDQYSAVRD